MHKIFMLCKHHLRKWLDPKGKLADIVWIFLSPYLCFFLSLELELFIRDEVEKYLVFRVGCSSNIIIGLQPSSLVIVGSRKAKSHALYREFYVEVENSSYGSVGGNISSPLWLQRAQCALPSWTNRTGLVWWTVIVWKCRSIKATIGKTEFRQIAMDQRGFSLLWWMSTGS